MNCQEIDLFKFSFKFLFVTKIYAVENLSSLTCKPIHNLLDKINEFGEPSYMASDSINEIVCET